MPFAQIVALLVSLLFLFFVLDLARKKKLKEKNALFWVGTCICFLGLAIFLMSLGGIADYLGILDPSIFVLFLGFSLLLCITLLLSIQISKIADDLKTVIQRLALLNTEMDGFKEKFAEGDKAEKD